MPTPRLSKSLETLIRAVWATDPAQSAKEVHGTVLELGHKVSVRKVQQLIRQVKDTGGGPWEPAEWKPWADPRETPTDMPNLFDTQMLMLHYYRRGMYVHEAEWARKLGPAMLDQPPNFRLLMIQLYAHRFEVGQILAMDKIETDDIDSILMYKPWTVEGLARYSAALEGDLIPPLVTLYAFEQQMDDKGIVLAALKEKLLHWIAIAKNHPSNIETIGSNVGPNPSQMIYDKVWTIPETGEKKGRSS